MDPERGVEAVVVEDSRLGVEAREAGGGGDQAGQALEVGGERGVVLRGVRLKDSNKALRTPSLKPLYDSPLRT